jgi:hypothetical protein
VERVRRLFRFGFGLLVAGGVYLLLIDTTDLPELYAGLAVVAFAALAYEAAREQGFPELAPRPALLRQAWRAVARVPPDIARVSLAALQQVLRPRRRRGRLQAVRFRHGGPVRGHDAARRALAEALGSLAPNTVIVGVDRERDLLLAHQLVPGGEIDVLELG